MRRPSGLRALVLVVDATLVVGAMLASYGIHSGLRPLIPALREPPALDHYAAIAYLALPLWITLLALMGAHRLFERDWTRLAILRVLARVHLLGFVALTVAIYLTRSTVNRALVTVFVGTSFVLTYAARVAILGWLRAQRRAGRTTTRVLLVGDDSESLRAFVAQAQASELPPIHLGRVGAPSERPTALQPLGPVTDLPQILEREAVDEVYFFPPHTDPRDAVGALDACETVGVPASFVIELDVLRRAKPELREAFGSAFVTYEVAAKPAAELAIKHAVDVLVAAVLVLVLAPLLAVVSVAILVGSGRPILFVQKRAGLRGRSFSMLKFRTMVDDAEALRGELESLNEMDGPVFKIERDPRVTRLGRWLRRSSIDELPQLFNVLTGSMSLVGPRPLPVAEQRAIRGWHRRRLSMKPGITGLWQVSGRSDVDFAKWMELDLVYVDTWSLSRDLVILLRTVPAVLGRRGAH